MKIAFFSDIHIGVHKNDPDWYKIALKWCIWFKQQLIEQKIDRVIFCGDFFHRRDVINVQTLNIGKKILDTISNVVPVEMLVGNHDCYYDDKTDVNSASPWKSNNIIVHEKLDIKNIGGLNFVFAPWGSDMYNLPKGDVLIAHCELNNFKLNSGRVSDCKLEANTLLEHIPLAFIGHIHTRSERSYPNGGRIIYVGNPFEQDYNDEGNVKGIYVLDTNTKDIVFVENKISPRHKKVYASKFNNENIDELKNTIVKLVVDKQINDDELTKLKTTLNTSSPFKVMDTDYIDQYENVQTVDGEYDISNGNIEQFIVEFIDKLDIKFKDIITEKTLNSYNKYTA